MGGSPCNKVICYSCGGHLKQLTREISPAELHQNFFPDCRHVRGLESNNVPLFETEDENTSRNGATGADFDPFPNLAGEGPAIAPPVSRESNLLLSSQQALTRSLGFSLSDAITQMSTSSLYHNQQASNVGNAGYQASLRSEISTCIGESERMKSEEERLKTFAHWSIAAHVRPRDLASAGFFYTGTGDSVKCAFCAGILRNWDLGDQPMQEHRRLFPTCQLVLGTVVGNGNHSTSRSGAPASVAGSGSDGSSAPHGGAPIFHGQDLGILTDKPKHQRFAIESVREKTFATWSAHWAQNPVNLAKAGFFYAGFSDNVKCFYCDGGLRNWEPQDDPWTEHARWFPRCGFVRQCKGEEFIRHVQELYPRQGTDTQPQLTVQNQAAITNVRRREAGQYVVEAREIKARLDTPTVQAVLEMGYPRDTVKKVIENRLRTTGDDFPNAESLFEAILSYEERQTPGEGREQTPSGVAEPTQDTLSPSRTPKPAKEEKKRGKKKQKSTEAKTTVGENDEEAKSLIEENQRLKEQRTCKICMDEEVSFTSVTPGEPEAKSLIEENQRLKEQRTCKICMDEEVSKSLMLDKLDEYALTHKSDTGDPQYANRPHSGLRMDTRGIG
ncbi:baculoviral IAP repeat-containing protein 7-like [Lingula anatina]|uniref:Baculoviral IAP repeat-containing protein 7-like n=1 Tax=Lingula anatina TaxID=7574 RepID=A0A1S3KA09_LINAN|nr:baculoviral IAP repeat-containing protein 7-like [Lingula anatina]|eukprot:XP_013419081.1 baculoviral IAP repeat-containing protein 7-like [Lingula anatina]